MISNRFINRYGDRSDSRLGGRSALRLGNRLGARRRDGFRRRLAALLAATLLALSPSCGAPRSQPRLPPPVHGGEPQVDILHYAIDVAIDHRARHVAGHVEIGFAGLPGRPVERLVLDAVEMRVERVTDENGRELAFAQPEGRLVIDLAAPLAPHAQGVVGIEYECYPRRGLYILPPTGDGPWQIWTQGQTHETRHWIPCRDRLDDRATHELRVTVDESFVTMAAGRLVSSLRDPAGRRRTDVWRMETPHAISLLTLVSGGLAQGEILGGDVPLPVLAEEASLPDALRNFADTPRMLALLERWTGRPYPYPKYAQSCVREFVAGGMENISATTLYHETVHDPADEPQVDSFDLVAHEAAHMWFGDLVGARDWSDLWLHEGFATWCEILCIDALRGRDEARGALLDYLREAADAALAGPLPIVRPRYDDPDDLFDSNTYAGGGARLALLETWLGADTLQRGVARFVREHEAGLVVTADLQAALEAESGQDLGGFFAQWLHGAGVPRFRLRLTDPGGAPAGAPEEAAALRVTQTQSELGWRPAFALTADVAWSRGGVERSERVHFSAADRLVPLAGEGPLDWVRFDAGTCVPGFLDMQQSEAMWRAQLGANDGVTRLIAAEWFAAVPEVRDGLLGDWTIAGDSLDALLEAARGDGFRRVRVTAIDALSAHAAPDEPAVPEALLALLRDADAAVREAAAHGLAERGDDSVLPALTAALDDPNAAVAAAALGALAARGHAGIFRLCVELAERTSKSRLDRAVLGVVAGLPDEPLALPFLLAAARHEVEPGVRAAALLGMAKADDPHDVAGRQLRESLYDRSHVVRAAAASALGLRGDRDARLALHARRAIEIDSTVLGAIERALDRLR